MGFVSIELCLEMLALAVLSRLNAANYIHTHSNRAQIQAKKNENQTSHPPPAANALEPLYFSNCEVNAVKMLQRWDPSLHIRNLRRVILKFIYPVRAKWQPIHLIKTK